VSSSSGDVVPHMSTEKSRLWPGNFVIRGGWHISEKLESRLDHAAGRMGVPGFLLSLPPPGEGQILQAHCRKLLRHPGQFALAFKRVA